MLINQSIKYSLLLCSLLLIVGLFSACDSKYQDGPLISFVPKAERVANNWGLGQITRNTYDETIQYDLFEINFDKGGTVTWKWQLDGSTTVNEMTAEWELANAKEAIKIFKSDKTKLAPLDQELLFMDIFRLKKNQLWLTYQIKTDYYDLRLTPQ